MTISELNYVEAVFGFDAVVRRVAEVDWDRQTACDDWVARDVVGHMCFTLVLTARMARGEDTAAPAETAGSGIPVPSDDDHEWTSSMLATMADVATRADERPVATWEESRRTLLEALDETDIASVVVRGPWGVTGMDAWLGFSFWDPLIHTWDLATAVGQPVVISPDLCDVALRNATAWDAQHNLRRPHVAPTPFETTSADPLDRLLAFAGRDPDWTQPS